MELLDCIYRVPKVMDVIIQNRKALTSSFMNYIEKDLMEINEIILVGSGTSNTCSQTSHLFIEKVSGLATSALLPNMFLEKSVFNPKALYIFTSQSGTSTLTQEAQIKMRDAGYHTCAITEDASSPLAKESKSHVVMETDHEEFGQRTIGYCASIMTQMMVGLEIGLARKAIDEKMYQVYIDQALAAVAHHPEICDATMKWFDKNKWKLMNKDGFVLYGCGDLWGVAQEGALKILEIAKRYLCVGYEMDDGMHGPTMGFTNRHAIMILNDGRSETIANGLAKYVKTEVSDAFVIGKNTLDDCDLPFVPVGGAFTYLEFAPVPEILAYRLAVDYGMVIKTWKDQDPLPEGKYFNTHDEE